MKKYLIPNTALTIILTNCKTLRRMRTKARWVNKYLIPNNTLTIILTNCMTLGKMRTKARWVNKYLLPIKAQNEKKYGKEYKNHIGYICLAFLHCVLSSWLVTTKVTTKVSTAFLSCPSCLSCPRRCICVFK